MLSQPSSPVSDAVNPPFWVGCLSDEIITLDDVTHHKPHPEPILKALENFNHQSVLMIGDSPSDLLAGINANTLTCGVAWVIQTK